MSRAWLERWIAAAIIVAGGGTQAYLDHRDDSLYEHELRLCQEDRVDMRKVCLSELDAERQALLQCSAQLKVCVEMAVRNQP